MRTNATDTAKGGAEGLGALKRWPFPRGEAVRYGLAPLAVAIALLIRLALAPVLDEASPYLLFVPAVLTAAGLAGLGPGLLATALSLVIGGFMVMPSSGLSTSAITSAVLFTLIGVGIAWSGGQLQRSRFRAA